MPSATTNTPPDVSIRNASSLLARGPGWVTPCAVTPIARIIVGAHAAEVGPVRSRVSDPWVYSDRGHLHGPGRARPGSVGPRTRPGRRRGPDPAAPPPVRRAAPRRRTLGAGTHRRGLSAAGRPRHRLRPRSGVRPTCRRSRCRTPASRRCGACTDASPSSASEQSRAIALHTRALKFAELAHDSRLIGLAHYELAMCYKRVGDSASSASTSTEAANALHAAGDKRHLALAHRLLGGSPGAGRPHAGSRPPSLRLAERLATPVHADDVLAGTAHNQAILALMSHRLDEALALAERSVALYRALGEGPWPGRHAGDPRPGVRADWRSRARRGRADAGARGAQAGPVPRDDRRGVRHAGADPPDARHLRPRQRISAPGRRGLRLRTARRPASGTSGRSRCWRSSSPSGAAPSTRPSPAPTSWWRRRTSRRPTPFRPISRRAKRCSSSGASPRPSSASRRCESRFDPRTSPANWGEFLRVRGALHARTGQQALAYHDFAQSVNIFDLLGRALSDGTRAPGGGPAGGRDRRARRGRAQPRLWRRRCSRCSAPRRDLGDVAAVRATHRCATRRAASARSSSRPTTRSSPG